MGKLQKNKRLFLISFFLIIVSAFTVGVQFKYGWDRIFRYARYYLFPTKTIMDDHAMELVLDLNPLWQLDPGYNDWLVHPSVEFIPEGLNGYKWWLAVTPYRGKYGKPSDWE